MCVRLAKNKFFSLTISATRLHSLSQPEKSSADEGIAHVALALTVAVAVAVAVAIATPHQLEANNALAITSAPGQLWLRLLWLRVVAGW